jgi:hypothetical protein
MTSELTTRAIRAFRNVLPVGVEVLLLQSFSGDVADILVAGVRLHIKWAGDGWPEDIKRALESVPGSDLVIASRRMSAGAIKLLREKRVGWVDETGGAEVFVGNLVISRSGRPDAVEKQGEVKRWTPAVQGVAEALLCGTPATVVATQAVTGLSSGMCAKALRFLADQGFLQAKAPRGRNSARKVKDLDALLESYARAVRSSKKSIELSVGLSWSDPIGKLINVGRKWDNMSLAWACTGAMAASLLAPHLSNVSSAEMYIAADTLSGLQASAAAVGLSPLEGGRLTLQPFPSKATQMMTRRHEQEQICLAPWPRVYADLLHYGVRGSEAAEHLKEVMRARGNGAN